MSFLAKLFGKKGEKQPTKVLNKAELKPYAKPALHLIPADRSDPGGSTKIGGLPDTAPGFVWPKWAGEDGKESSLSFLGQLNFEELGALQILCPNMPQKGLLSFFYDQEQSTWGFDPKDRGSWRVLFQEETSNLTPAALPEDISDEARYKEVRLQAKQIDSYLSVENEKLAHIWNDDELSDQYAEFVLEQYEHKPSHQILGYPQAVQNPDIDEEAAMVSSGIYIGSGIDRDSEDVQKALREKDQWVLLLQLDTDDDAEMMWGDVGTLYFYIHLDDLKKKDFSNVWMILQCG